MQRIVLFTFAALVAGSAAHAFEDEMMGTRVNGRMERRDEGFDRVNDPKMDYHGEHDTKPRLGDTTTPVPPEGTPPAPKPAVPQALRATLPSPADAR